MLVGYEALVILRPQNPHPDLIAKRVGNTIEFTNKGNTNVLLQSGQQCESAGHCKELTISRIYAGQSWSVTCLMAKHR
ncbi:MAG: hypothetical protein IPP74_00020 [Alphaproteobacteria bacterium]|nr:hypothetical protein [Alphaproteobacteria bacterium]